MDVFGGGVVCRVYLVYYFCWEADEGKGAGELPEREIGAVECTLLIAQLVHCVGVVDFSLSSF